MNPCVNPDKATVVNPKQDLSFGYHRYHRYDDIMYEQTYQENYFEINKSYPGQIETDATNSSNDPNNSTFTNFNPDTCIQSSTDFNAPPSKIPRFCNLKVDNFGPNHTATTVNNDDTFANKYVKPRGHQYFPARAAGIIAAKMLKKEKVGFLRNYRVVQQHLKKCIESRIAVIMEDKVANTINQIIRFYRLEYDYADDPQLFKDALEKTQRDMAEHPNPGDTSASDDDDNNVAGQTSNTFKPNEMPIQRKLYKIEYTVEDMYDLDPMLLKAFNEELHKLCEAFLMASSQPEDDEDEEKFRLILRNSTPYTFKKVMRIQLLKRLLNITDNLLIRIFTTPPKAITRDELEQFLKEKGITYVKKSLAKKLYVAMAPNFEVYDHLLAMQHIVIGDCNLEFRPLYLISPPVRQHHRKKILVVEEDNDESVDDEELERLIEETENKVIKKNENVNVVLTGNEKQFAGTDVEILDDDDDKIVPGGAQAGGIATNGNYNIDVVRDKTNQIVTIEDDKNNVQVDDSKTKAEKEADEPEKGNKMNNESDVVTVADNAELEINEGSLCAVDVDDDDLEDF